MMIKKPSAIFALFLIFTFAASSAFACACCAEPGHYSIRTNKPSQYQLKMLEEIGFDKTARLFMTEAGFEMIKGLDELEAEMSAPDWIADSSEINLSGVFATRSWKLNFKTPKGKTGVLTLPLPSEMVNYSVDIRDGKNGGGGPLLYKEWRFKGRVQSGTGFLQAGVARPTTYFLVFQGRGNGCDDVTNFSDWHLEINGSRAKYEFFGKLSSGVSVAADERAEN